MSCAVDYFGPSVTRTGASANELRVERQCAVRMERQCAVRVERQCAVRVAVAGALTLVISADLKSIRVLVKCILPKGTG